MKLVQIVNIETKAVAREFECATERQAERIEMGILHNLDHDRFFTRVIEKDTATPASV